jgi:hypothetical protein
MPVLGTDGSRGGAAGFLAYGSSDEGANGPAEGDDEISYALGACTSGYVIAALSTGLMVVIPRFLVIPGG